MKVALIGAELEENLALRYIYSSLEASGHTPRIFDFHASSQISTLATEILEWNPHMVGLSMVFTIRAGQFIELAEKIRAGGSEAHITAGGHFASFNARKLLDNYHVLDSIVRGEGEETMVDLASSHGNYSEIPGLSYRDGNNDVVINPPRQNIPDIDSRPWPTRGKDFHRYLGLPIANILAGRGCYANCAFCSINAWHKLNGGQRFRARCIENVADEMSHLYHNHGIRIFNFHDDNFFLPDNEENIARFHKLRENLRNNDVGRIGIQIKARPDNINSDVLKILKDIGLFRVFLGVENGSLSGLKALNRGISLDQNHAAIRILDQFDIHTTFNLLLFEPDCQMNDIRTNLDFMRFYSRYPLNFCRTEVYSGTQLHKRLSAEGRLEGDYFGYHYQIADQQVQDVFEIFREVFMARNFAPEGTNHRAMQLDYYFHLLKLFYPSRIDKYLRQRKNNLILSLNNNSVDLMMEICDYAESSTDNQQSDREAFIERLKRQREEADNRFIIKADALLTEIEKLSGTRQRQLKTRLSKLVSSAAAAAVLVSVTGCTPPEVCEMAPVPMSSPEDNDHPKPELAPPSSRAADTHSREMVAPPLPGNKPATPEKEPPSKPEIKQISGDQMTDIQKQIENSYQKDLDNLGKKHSLKNKTISVEITLSNAGSVTSSVILIPENELTDFRTDLTKMIGKWNFKKMDEPGKCRVTLNFLVLVKYTPPKKPEPPGGWEMCEMAPIPMD